MDFDISSLLENWEYEPGNVVVRKFTAGDGTEKIQLRVDLGLLQMNARGRPDGKRPFGCESLFEHYQKLAAKRMASGDSPAFILKAEDCSRLQIEALQYHHRYICLLQLDEFEAAIRDAQRNLDLFDFVAQHAESEDMVWSLRQFEPQLRMIQTRARASLLLGRGQFDAAMEKIDQGLEELRRFYAESPRPDAVDFSGEIESLESWREEVQQTRPLSRRETLERDLLDAVRREDYERAAQVRDELRGLSESAE